MSKKRYILEVTEIPLEVWEKLEPVAYAKPTAERCSVIPNVEMDIPRLSSREDEWQVCDSNCARLSECKRISNQGVA